MSLSSIVQKIDDSMNPIVVKELKQAVTSRIVIGIMLFFMFVLLCALGISLSSSLLSGYSGSGGAIVAGRNVFMAMNGTLAFFSLAFLPAYIGIRMSKERSESIFDLHFITTMSPGAIVRGKMMAGIVLLFLYFCTCLPFLTLTYLLRGIDLFTIFAILAMSFLCIFSMSQLALFVACIPCSKFFKFLLAFFTAGLMLNLFAGIMAGSSELVRSGVGSLMSEPSFWENLFLGILLYLGFYGLLHVLTTSIITPAAHDRAFSIRIYLMFFWLASFCISLYKAIRDTDVEFVAAWVSFWLPVFSIWLVAAVSERDSISARVKRKIRKSRFFFHGFVLFQGGAGGFCWCVLMAVLTLFAVQTTVFTESLDLVEGDLIDGLTGFFLYFVVYALSALSIRRFVPQLSHRNKFTWVIALILCAVMNIMPVFFALLSGSEQSLYSLTLVANPFYALKSPHNLNYLVLITLSVLLLILNISWFYDRVRQFADARKREKLASQGNT